jgi:hypothetical protein
MKVLTGSRHYRTDGTRLPICGIFSVTTMSRIGQSERRFSRLLTAQDSTFLKIIISPEGPG